MRALGTAAALLAAVLAAAPAGAQIERQRGGGSRGGGAPSGNAPSGNGGGGYGGRGWHGGGGGIRGGGEGMRGSSPSESRPSSPPVIMKTRRVEVHGEQPRAFERPEHVVRDGQRATPPERDWRGRAITQPRATQPPAEHTTIVRNQAVVHSIIERQRSEIAPRRYYWHNDGGIRYAHYYDGYHWYGFYHGPRFYWTRYWADRWWWYDPVFARWVFWWDGHWWWYGPRGAFFVYVDNSYYPYEDGAVYVKQPEVDAPAAELPKTAAEGSTHDSPDGKREVQVYGDRSEAFLYEKTGSSPVFLTFLGSNVSGVRFSGGKDGKPLRILLDFKDGSFALYDKDGKPLDGAGAEGKSAAVPAQAPPAAPASTPPGGETAPQGAGSPPPADSQLPGAPPGGQ